MILPTIGRIVDARRHPIVRSGIVSAARVNFDAITKPTPDDHFTTGPHCRVTGPYSRHINRARGCPAIRARIVFAAAV